jgi:hypothetical protein
MLGGLRLLLRQAAAQLAGSTAHLRMELEPVGVGVL